MRIPNSTTIFKHFRTFLISNPRQAISWSFLRRKFPEKMKRKELLPKVFARKGYHRRNEWNNLFVLVSPKTDIIHYKKLRRSYRKMITTRIIGPKIQYVLSSRIERKSLSFFSKPSKYCLKKSAKKLRLVSFTAKYSYFSFNLAL